MPATLLLEKHLYLNTSAPRGRNLLASTNSTSPVDLPPDFYSGESFILVLHIFKEISPTQVELADPGEDADITVTLAQRFPSPSKPLLAVSDPFLKVSEGVWEAEIAMDSVEMITFLNSGAEGPRQAILEVEIDEDDNIRKYQADITLHRETNPSALALPYTNSLIEVKVADAAARKSLATYTDLSIVPYPGMQVTQIDQNDGDDNSTVIWRYVGMDITEDANWKGYPLTNSDGDLVGPVINRTGTDAQLASIVPSIGEVMIPTDREGVVRIGRDGTSSGGEEFETAKNYATGSTSTAVNSFQSGIFNTQSGQYNTQSGYSNTQSGYRNSQSGANNTQNASANTQSGIYNTQTGAVGFQSGQNLDDGGFNNVYSLGSTKTAIVGSTAYFWIDNGIRIKPIAGDPSTLEDGTIWITTTGELKYRANGVTKTVANV